MQIVAYYLSSSINNGSKVLFINIHCPEKTNVVLYFARDNRSCI